MLGVRVEEGALYYALKRRRVPVTLDEALRAEVEAAALRLHELFRERRVPVPEFGAKCRACSLAPACLPRALGRRTRGSDWLRNLVRDAEDE
jgi:CRISPR-associated exonuclease Cas4